MTVVFDREGCDVEGTSITIDRRVSSGKMVRRQRTKHLNRMMHMYFGRTSNDTRSWNDME
jgi:hypothetical protein